MKFHGNVRGEVRVNFLALFVSKPHTFLFGFLTLRESLPEHCHSKSFFGS